jgi:hypothetical protein
MVPCFPSQHRTESVQSVLFVTHLRAALTLEERMRIAEIWVRECRRLGMKSVVHVSHMCLRTARDLARHAAEVGADSIGMYPPFAPEAPPNLAAVALSIDFATRDVNLPLYYYHIPAVTGVVLNVSDLVAHAKRQALLPRLAGSYLLLLLLLLLLPPPPLPLLLLLLLLLLLPSSIVYSENHSALLVLHSFPALQVSSSSAATSTISPKSKPTKGSMRCGRLSPNCRFAAAFAPLPCRHLPHARLNQAAHLSPSGYVLAEPCVLTPPTPCCCRPPLAAAAAHPLLPPPPNIARRYYAPYVRAMSQQYISGA